jgi:hypothetical protein
MRTFIGTVPLSALALAVSFVVAIVLSRPAASWLHTRPYIAGLLLLGFALVFSATLVPTAAALEGVPSDGVCDTSRIGIAPIEELTSVNTSSLNVLLFMPLGVAVGLLPWSRAAAVAALAAASLTFIVEAIQLLVPVLGRGCQTADLVDNLMGLAIGLAIGLSARLVLPQA